jgi:hypothetical protein
VDRYVEPDRTGMYPTRYLVFFDTSGGKVDAYRGIKADSHAMVEYVEGILALKGKTREAELAFYFKYLDHKERDIADDATRELGRARGEELNRAAKHIRPEPLRRLLLTPEVPAVTRATAARLLGVCGVKSDVDFLHLRFAALEENDSTLRPGVLFGLALARCRHGDRDGTLALLKDQLTGPERPFVDRYSALLALRSFRDEWPGLIPAKELRAVKTHGMGDHDDMTDFIVEDLRKEKAWDLTDRVLGLWPRLTPDSPKVTRRAIVLFALQSPRPAAAAFVRQVRQADAHMVSACEAFLKAEDEVRAAVRAPGGK